MQETLHGTCHEVIQCPLKPPSNGFVLTNWSNLSSSTQFSVLSTEQAFSFSPGYSLRKPRHPCGCQSPSFYVRWSSLAYCSDTSRRDANNLNDPPSERQRFVQPLSHFHISIGVFSSRHVNHELPITPGCNRQHRESMQLRKDRTFCFCQRTNRLISSQQ